MTDKAHRDTFSFSAAGWLQMYHFGVCKALQDTGLADYQQVRFAGSSAGALASTAIIAKCDFNDVRKYSNECCRDARKSIWNGLKIRSYVATGVRLFASEPFVKDRANLKARMEDQVEIYVTVLPWVTAKKMNKFDDVEDLVEALTASCCVTPLAGMPFPLRKTGEIVIDGGLAAFQPRAGEPNVITVSPMYFSTVDIKPSVYIPATWGLYPPDEESYDKLFDIGYNDALHFLVKTGRLPRRALSKLKNLELQSTVYASRYFTSPVTSPLGSPATHNAPASGKASFSTNGKPQVVDIELCPECQNEHLIGDAKHYVAFTPTPGNKASSQTAASKTDAAGMTTCFKCPSCGAKHGGASGGSGEPILLEPTSRPSGAKMGEDSSFILFSLINKGYSLGRRTVRKAKQTFRLVILSAVDISAIAFFFVFIRMTALFVIYSEMMFATWTAFGFAFLQYIPVIGRRFRHPNPASLVPTEVKRYLYPGESTDEDEADFDEGSFYLEDDAELRPTTLHYNNRSREDLANNSWGTNAYYDTQQVSALSPNAKNKGQKQKSVAGKSGNDSDDLGENVAVYMRKQKAKMKDKARQASRQQKQTEKGSDEVAFTSNGDSNYDNYDNEDPFSSDAAAMKKKTAPSPFQQNETTSTELKQRRPTRRDTNRFTASLAAILTDYLASVDEDDDASSAISNNSSSGNKSSPTEGGETMEISRPGKKRDLKIRVAQLAILKPSHASHKLAVSLAETIAAIACDIVSAEEEDKKLETANANIMNRWALRHLAMANAPAGTAIKGNGEVSEKSQVAAWVAMQKQFVEIFLLAEVASESERSEAVAALALMMTGASSQEEILGGKKAESESAPLLLSPTSPTAATLKMSAIANKRMSRRACCQLAMQVAASKSMCSDLWDVITLIANNQQQPQQTTLAIDFKVLTQNPSFSAKTLSALIFRFPESFGLALAASLEAHRVAWVEEYKRLTCLVPGATTGADLSATAQRDSLNRRGKNASPSSKAREFSQKQKQKQYKYREAWKDVYEHIRNLFSLRVLLHLVVGEKVPVNVRRLYHRSTAYRLLQPYLAAKKDQEAISDAE